MGSGECLCSASFACPPSSRTCPVNNRQRVLASLCLTVQQNGVDLLRTPVFSVSDARRVPPMPVVGLIARVGHASPTPTSAHPRRIEHGERGQ